MQQADSLVDELQDALDADQIEEGRLEALKLQLIEAQEDLTTQKNSYGEAVVAKDKNNEAVRSTRDQMAAIDTEIKDVEAKVSKAESKATRCSNERSGALRDKNVALDAIAKERRDREQYEKEHDEQVLVVDNFISQATEHCPRVPVDEGETGDSIELKYEKLQKDLEAAERRYVLDPSSSPEIDLPNGEPVLGVAKAKSRRQLRERSKHTTGQEMR